MHDIDIQIGETSLVYVVRGVPGEVPVRGVPGPSYRAWGVGAAFPRTHPFAASAAFVASSVASFGGSYSASSLKGIIQHCNGCVILS